jgi:hypothetical protein
VQEALPALNGDKNERTSKRSRQATQRITRRVIRWIRRRFTALI